MTQVKRETQVISAGVSETEEAAQASKVCECVWVFFLLKSKRLSTLLCPLLLLLQLLRLLTVRADATALAFVSLTNITVL